MKRRATIAMRIRKWLLDIVPTVLAAVLIVYFAIVREQSVLKTLPTLITLCVQLLLVSANRYAFLLGGLNAVLYGVAYLSEGLYFSLISALLISAPIQLFSFFHWGKHRGNGKQTELKLLSWSRRVITLTAILTAFGVCYFCLAPFFAGANHPLLDALVFTLGVTVSLLAAFRYVESQYISVLSTVIQIVMWILIAYETPGNFNYVIISVYNCFRITQAAVHWTRSYLRSKGQKEKDL